MSESKGRGKHAHNIEEKQKTHSQTARQEHLYRYKCGAKLDHNRRHDHPDHRPVNRVR